MRELAPKQRRSRVPEETDRDAQMKQALQCLEIENGQLKQLVVRLSETIIKNVVGRR